MIEHLTLVEHESDSYAPRTRVNAESADLTIAFAVDFTTAGEKLTASLAKNRYFSVNLTTTPHNIASEQLLPIWYGGTINIAGNGIYTLVKHGWSQSRINEYIFLVINRLHTVCPITTIRSGGQTGADVAGAIAGLKLGIPTIVTMPRGYKLRRADNRDKTFTADQIIARYQHYLD